METREPKDGAKLRTRRVPNRAMAVVYPQDGNDPFEGKVVDLSMGGMFVETIMALKPGTICEIETAMPQMRFRGQARVLWVRNVGDGDDKPIGMGVEWINQTAAQKKLLYRQVNDHLRGGGDLLVGVPDPSEASTPAISATKLKAASPAPPQSIDRRWLIIGIVVAAVVVIVVVLMLR